MFSEISRRDAAFCHSGEIELGKSLQGVWCLVFPTVGTCARSAADLNTAVLYVHISSYRLQHGVYSKCLAQWAPLEREGRVSINTCTVSRLLKYLLIVVPLSKASVRSQETPRARPWPSSAPPLCDAVFPFVMCACWGLIFFFGPVWQMV